MGGTFLPGRPKLSQKREGAMHGGKHRRSPPLPAISATSAGLCPPVALQVGPAGLYLSGPYSLGFVSLGVEVSDCMS